MTELELQRKLKDAEFNESGFAVVLALKDHGIQLIEANKKLIAEREKLRTDLEILKAALEWYANWDWSDKYVQAVPKRANEALSSIKRGSPVKTKHED
jgi:hypothetical protein